MKPLKKNYELLTLEELGYNSNIEKFRKDNNLDNFEIGRIIAEHKERYIVRTAEAEFDCEITGNMRFTARSRADFPAAGDWVTITPFDEGSAIIHGILPRSSVISRQAIGQQGDIQIIAANIDYAFIVQASDRDFNINRIERYLTICNAANVKPVIILSKTDLVDDTRLSELLNSIKNRVKDIPVIPLSNESYHGYEEIRSLIEKGKTYCLLGSSGVGKSTLINNLAGRDIMKTDAISMSTNKGRHITSHRELIILENGGILIDNPGMKEVGIADSTGGLEATFDMILQLAGDCRFKDCTHTTEDGCAVLDAVMDGRIDRSSYDNYLKMEKERAHFESSVSERRKKDKEFGKYMKNYKKDMKKNRP